VVVGARSPDIANVEVMSLRLFEAEPAEVPAALGTIVGTTENRGYKGGRLRWKNLSTAT
jgi:hypothetical protein